MTKNSKEHLPHLLIKNSTTTESYSRPARPNRAEINIPARNRQTHAQQLLEQIQQIQTQETEIIKQQKTFGLDGYNGIYLVFESEPDFELKFASLEFQSGGIELCNVKLIDNKTQATIFVPEGKLAYFLKKITQYQSEDTNKNKPKNRELVESISAIKLAAIDALWTDNELMPEAGQTIWWEVWLRRSSKIDYEAFLRDHAPQLDLKVGAESIYFLDRIIVLVFGSREQISQSIHLLGAIAELRKAKDTADFFTGMSRQNQRAWIEQTTQSLTPPPDNAPAVCVLDTGINHEHPLLQPVAKTLDMHTYHPDWGTDDRDGHGTNMAGVSIYGDLTKALADPLPIQLTHHLESVKITPNPDHHTDKKLYGAITRDSIANVEITAANRQRVFCMAVSSTDNRERGRPSSWSATIDAITSGAEDEQQRLVMLSAGNTEKQYRHQYPDNNLTDEVHDPGQSWNALTVGGYTEKIWLDTTANPDWTPLAPAGGLAPASCTSMTWQKTWPIKPDIVMEAGNMAINPAYQEADYIDDALQLLTTGHQFALGKQLVSFGDTSAAAALAANLSAKLQALYPDFWPETIRALLIHSAQWTPAMKAKFSPLDSKDKYRQLLRYCGYGVPDEETLFWSARNELTLIAQDIIYPYTKEGSNVKTRDINVHTLPWPIDVLHSLPPTTQVELKVTLSYFIEPNPGERGWVNKYRYASHGFRFDVRRPLETLSNFRQRINQKARDEENTYNGATPDSGQWLLGEKLRSLGSVHTDTWTGTAAELAERGYIAVYPVLGWWKERANLERWGKSARYALIVSIKTPSVETDIYTPIENQINVAITV